jgi:hypothetical protein
MPPGSSLRALLRFWWLVVLGLIVAALVGTLALYRVEAGLPPSFTARQQPTYTATEKLLVDTAKSSYFQTAVDEVNTPKVVVRPAATKIVRVPQVSAPVRLPAPTGDPRIDRLVRARALAAQRAAKAAEARLRSVPSVESKPAPETQLLELPPTVTQQAPPTDLLVKLANIYPSLIVSDEVHALRTQLYGAIPGTVHAEALYAKATAARYRPSPLPFIQVTATSAKAGDAIGLAKATSDAFIRRVEATQKDTDVAVDQRVVIRKLAEPTGATSSGAQSPALGLMAGAATVAGFVLLALALDRVLPRRRRDRVDAPAPAAA